MSKKIYRYLDDELASFSKDMSGKLYNKRYTNELRVIQDHEHYNGNHFSYQSVMNGVTSLTSSNTAIIPLSSVYIENKAQNIVEDLEEVLEKDMFSENDDESEILSIALQKILEKINRENNIKSLKYDTVLYSLVDNVAWRKVYLERVGDKVKVIRDRVEWYNVLWDFSAKKFENSSCMGEIFSGVIGEYDAKIGWDMKDVVPESRWKRDETVNSIQKTVNGETVKNEIDAYNTFTGIEWQCPVWVTDDLKSWAASQKSDPMGNSYEWVSRKKTGERIMFIFDEVQAKVRRSFLANYSRYNIFPYCLKTGQIYSPSFFHRLVSMGQRLDQDFTNSSNFVDSSSKAILYEERGSIDDEDRMESKNGVLLKVRKGAIVPGAVQRPQLPPSQIELLAKDQEFLQTLVNQPSVMQGQNISGSKKAQFAKQMQQQVKANNQPLIDKYIEADTAEVKFILELLADNMKVEELDIEIGETNKTISIVGENYKNYFESNYGPNEQKDKRNEIEKSFVLKRDFPVHMKMKSEADFTDESIFNLLITASKENVPPEVLKVVFGNDPRILPYIEELKKFQQQQQQQQMQEQQIEQQNQQAQMQEQQHNQQQQQQQMQMDQESHQTEDAKNKLEIIKQVQEMQAKMSQQPQQTQVDPQEEMLNRYLQAKQGL